MSQNLPRRVREELEQAEAIEKAIAEEQEKLAAANQPAAEPESEEQQAEQPAEEQTAEVQPEQESEPKRQKESESDVWEVRYRTLQSKYDIEVPRLYQQNRELTEQIENLQRQVELISETAEESKPEPGQVEAKYVTDKDEDEFGQELIDLQRRVAKEEIASLTAQNQQLAATVKELREQISILANSQQQVADGSFLTQLSRLVPNWEEIDSDPEWLKWLAEVDPLSGRNRQSFLNEAHAALDAKRVATFFDAFLKSKGKSSSKSELNRQVTPKKNSAPSAPPAQEKVWSQSEIAAALDPRKLKHMSQKEVEALMSEIDAAQRDGRII